MFKTKTLLPIILLTNLGAIIVLLDLFFGTELFIKDVSSPFKTVLASALLVYVMVCQVLITVKSNERIK